MLQQKQNALGQFLDQYIKQKQITVNQFAYKANISHVTIGDIINGKVKRPSILTLEKLSGATGANILTLLAMVSPQYVTHPSPEVIALEQEINSLPAAHREIVLTLIRALGRQSPESGDG